MTPQDTKFGPALVYSPTARILHWTTVAFLLVQFPLGKAMDWRGNDLNIWDAVTNNMYSAHKLIGMLVLLLVLVRLGYRLSHGALADEPTLERWQKVVSHITHWTMYALLIAVPMLGWLGVQLYPALDVFGLFSLPAWVSPNESAAARALATHAAAAFLLAALIAMHFGAAMFHYFVRKDGVLNRMWPSSARRDNG